MTLKKIRKDNYPEWYQCVVNEADMAENSSSPGCMVIKPWGYGIWERIRDVFDEKIKSTDHENCYFPMFIPLSFFQKEAEHVDGFAKEMAVVTHSRLSMKDGKLTPDSKLEEPLIVRPTSEAIIADSFSKWVKAYRDLPVLVNQWANVVRWEMRPRLFLRTREFLWQEGHTAHATAEEAEERTVQMLNVYADFCEEVLAMPVIRGRKTEKEKFAGAVATYTIEALMKDGQALQSGTSHFFGQGFCEHFGIKFLDSDNTQKIPWQTSWGVSTRLIGAVIMVHGDDNGLVLPPYVAPVQVMIIPIKADKDENVAKASEELLQKLLAKGIRAKCDFSKKSPGWKFSQYEMKGVPVRIEVGPRDLAEGNVTLTRRVDGVKKTLKIDDIPSMIEEELKDIHETMYNKALDYLNSHIVETKDYQTLGEIVTHGKGYAKVMWCGDRECEDKVKADYNASSRCMPFDQTPIGDKCVVCGKPAKYVVLFDRAY